MARLVCLLCVSLCFLKGLAQNLNNIDVLEPRWRVSPDRALPTLAGTNDYFGWTAIFHALEEPVQSDSIEQAQEKIRVIVGAPFGTFPGGLSPSIYRDTFLPRVDRTGLVYSCPLSSEACEGVDGNVTEYIDDEVLSNNRIIRVPTSERPFMPVEYAEGRLFDQSPTAQVSTGNLPSISPTFGTYNYGSKEGQLMGAFLYSDGDNFMACAPAWKLTLGLDPFQAESTRGMCYSSGRTLDNFAPRMACTDPARNTDSNPNGLQCLSGHSGVVNNNHFVIGAPGYSSSRGILASVPTNAPAHTMFSLGDAVARADNGSAIPSTNTRSQDQYQGFRTVNAFILNLNNPGTQPNLVTSVPRAGVNKNGRLHVYASPTTLDNLIFTNATGDQTGEFFGYSLAAADLNNDRYDEVIVGAPMYTDFSTNTIEKGRVYIFRNSGSSPDFLSNADKIVIDGPSSLPARARFGSSLTTLGDVDRDGYLDFAVGAPYYRAGSSSNTGAVFIYYGRADMNDIPNQTPFMITADTMAMRLALSGPLLTFGFSLSSGHDVDGNEYNDLLVGAYESQSVFVLRSLPVAEVTVTFQDHPIVDIDTSDNFSLTIRATMSGVSVNSMLDVPFQIDEVLPTSTSSRRVFFNAARTESAKGMGTFSFRNGVPASTDVVVYTSSAISDFTNFTFSITLLDVNRPVANTVSGSEPFTDLSSFPRLRLQGQTMTQVEVQNFCSVVGDDGCSSDVRFMGAASVTDIPVIANGPTEGQTTVAIINDGPEPALNLEIYINPLPDYVTGVTSNEIACSTKVNSSATCNYQERYNRGQRASITFSFQFDTTMLTGNENNSPVNLQLRIPNMNGNVDPNPSNNDLTLEFEPGAIADITLSAIVFNPMNPTYTGVAPTQSLLDTRGVNAFDTEVSLEVTVGNEGPSTIQNATLDVFFPSSEESITGAFTFLYPYDIQTGPVFTCNRTLLDPDQIQQRLSISMGKRSVLSPSERMAQRRHNRAASTNPRMASSSKRAKRQANTYDLDCMPGTRSSCSMFTCAIVNLQRTNVSITIRSRLDERFFATLNSETGRRDFKLRAFAAVRVDNTYIDGDEDTNNQRSGDLDISPMITDSVGGVDLLHVILWPALASLFLLVILVVVLYFCGFFRRKRKDDGETEFDDQPSMPMATPTDGGGKSFSPNKQPYNEKEEIAAL